MKKNKSTSYGRKWVKFVAQHNEVKWDKKHLNDNLDKERKSWVDIF